MLGYRPTLFLQRRSTEYNRASVNNKAFLYLNHSVDYKVGINLYFALYARDERLNTVLGLSSFQFLVITAVRPIQILVVFSTRS